MCCFSGPIALVAGTKVFARSLPDGAQLLAYSMRFDASEALAMILPLPVPPRSAEDAVTFIDLEGYAGFFDHVDQAFPIAEMEAGANLGVAPRVQASATPLVVHEVGLFEASFVPTLADFGRLDARFTLAPEVWAKLPRYADWGFAVFKLKPPEAPPPRSWWSRVLRGKETPTRNEPRTIHPIAFRFPRRDPKTLFFPTLHIHDGEVHAQAAFDHTLYCQLEESRVEALPPDWQASTALLGRHVDEELAGGLIDPESPCHRRILIGMHVNEDIELGVPTSSGP